MPAAFAARAISSVIPRAPALHAGFANGPHDVEPVVSQVRLAADERDLAHAKLRHLPDEIERLVCRELVGPRVSGARAAVPARKVALQRDFPDRIHGTPPAIDRANVVGQREPSPRRSRDWRDGR
jgi:hypothetical protein